VPPADVVLASPPVQEAQAADRFQLFGASHSLALALIALAAIALSWWVKGRPHHQTLVRRLLAALLLAAGGCFLTIDALNGTPWSLIAPLHICDAAVFIGAYALLTRKQLPFELIYFWGCAAATAALLTPDLGHDFPHYRFVFYFAQHGTIVIAAVVLAAGAGMRTRPRAPLFAWLWLNAYAALIAIVNTVFDTNFLYLRRPPGSASPLDSFGPWPSYIIVVELLTLALFYLLSLPVRQRDED
jgi:hypothetical integral membrane protein (TIGR02206 family)